MDVPEFERAMGKIILASWSLEFALRRFLHRVDGTNSTLPAAEPVSVGQSLLSSALTNHDSLGKLIERFNHSVTEAKKGGLALDPTLPHLQEILTEGRIWGEDPRPPVRLVMFSVPANGLVTCTFDASIDEVWLEEQENRVRSAHAQVIQAGEEIHQTPWTPSLLAGARG
jgi:hypothetical protein